LTITGVFDNLYAAIQERRMPLTGQVIDIYDDTDYSGLQKLASASAYGNTKILSPEEHAALPDSQFALVVLTKHANIVRKFPINDPGHALLASHYFGENHEKLSAVEKVTAATHIRNACNAYGVECDNAVEKYAADVSEVSNIISEGAKPKWYEEQVYKGARDELTKVASAEIDARMSLPDEQYALILDQEGEVVRSYAMPDVKHVKIASAYFKKYATHLHPTHRHQFASNVMRRADELGVELEKTAHLEQWASPNYNSKVNWHLEQRKSLLPRNEEACGVLDKLASLQESTDPVTFATALHEFDQGTGLNRYYDNKLADPWASTMSAEKNASWSTSVDGDIITTADLQRVANSSKLASYFGSTFSGQFKKHAVEVFESLPKPEKVLIKQMARGEI
jgi:hypothetical protein